MAVGPSQPEMIGLPTGLGQSTYISEKKLKKKSTKNSTLNSSKSRQRLDIKLEKELDAKVDMTTEKVEGNQDTYWAP